MNSISTIIITRNEEKNIRDCLVAVRWTDEIVVVDTGSTDKTVAIAKKITSKVFTHRWEGFGAARQFALSKCTKYWVLSVDADERVTPQLKEEILAALSTGNNHAAGYAVPIKACFLGRWILHCGWYPAYKTRIFRRDRSSYSESKLHEAIQVQGEILELKSDLLHYTDPNLFHYFEKLNQYTSLGADQIVQEGTEFRVSQLLLRPFWTFIKMYFIKAGFLDGIQGFILCVLSSCYVFTKYAKLWEHTSKRESCT